MYGYILDAFDELSSVILRLRSNPLSAATHCFEITDVWAKEC